MLHLFLFVLIGMHIAERDGHTQQGHLGGTGGELRRDVLYRHHGGARHQRLPRDAHARREYDPDGAGADPARHRDRDAPCERHGRAGRPDSDRPRLCADLPARALSAHGIHARAPHPEAPLSQAADK